MEATVEYPDADLSSSPVVGVVFRLPTHNTVEEGSEHSDSEDRRRSYIRPHSAKALLKKKPTTLQAFKDDVLWATENVAAPDVSIEHQHDVDLCEQQHDVDMREQQHDVDLCEQQQDVDLCEQQHDVDLCEQQHDLCEKQPDFSEENLAAPDVSNEQQHDDDLCEQQHDDDLCIQQNDVDLCEQQHDVDLCEQQHDMCEKQPDFSEENLAASDVSNEQQHDDDLCEQQHDVDLCEKRHDMCEKQPDFSKENLAAPDVSNEQQHDDDLCEQHHDDDMREQQQDVDLCEQQHDDDLCIQQNDVDLCEQQHDVDLCEQQHDMCEKQPDFSEENLAAPDVSNEQQHDDDLCEQQHDDNLCEQQQDVDLCEQQHDVDLCEQQHDMCEKQPDFSEENLAAPDVSNEQQHDDDLCEQQHDDDLCIQQNDVDLCEQQHDVDLCEQQHDMCEKQPDFSKENLAAPDVSNEQQHDDDLCEQQHDVDMREQQHDDNLCEQQHDDNLCEQQQDVDLCEQQHDMCEKQPDFSEENLAAPDVSNEQQHDDDLCEQQHDDDLCIQQNDVDLCEQQHDVDLCEQLYDMCEQQPGACGFDETEAMDFSDQEDYISESDDPDECSSTVWPFAQRSCKPGSLEEISDSEEELNPPHRNSVGNEKASDMESHEIFEKVLDMNNAEIFVRKIIFSKTFNEKEKKNDRVQNSVHACYFCDNVKSHIQDHLLRKHSDEKEIMDIVKRGIDKNEQEKLKSLVRAKGDHKHNLNVISEKRGELILFRRPKENFDSAQFGPCPKCLEWMMRKSLAKHQKTCKGYSQGEDEFVPKKNYLQAMSDFKKGVINQEVSPVLLKEVFTIMRKDTVGVVAQSDALIINLGEKWLQSCVDNPTKRPYWASQHMRHAAKLLLELRELDKSDQDESDSEEDKTLWDFLRPSYFDYIVKASLNTALPDFDDVEDLKSPSNALKIKYDIITMAERKASKSNQQYDKTNLLEWKKSKKEAEGLLEDVRRVWKNRVTKVAKKILLERKLMKKEQLPHPRDIEKLAKYLKEELVNADLNKSTVTWPVYKQLCKYAQTRLMSYNKRRSGEMENVTVKNYMNKLQIDDIDEGLIGEITPMERYLMESHDLIQIRGKKSSVVPVLIPPECSPVINFLADRGVRSRVGINPKNDYLFPNKGPSLDLPSRVLPSKARGIRPWSAQPKLSKTSLPNQRKVSRQTLRKPHLRPPARSPTASVSSEGSSLITAVGLANRKGFDTSTPDSTKSDRHAKCFSPESRQSAEKWAVTIAEAITESKEKTEPLPKPEPLKRSLKKHQSFETWIEGSPHDSEEYDTDVDIEDYVKNLKEEYEKEKRIRQWRKRTRRTTKGNIKEGRPLDPTGTVMYMDQCKVQGLIPVSYIQRHLGDKNLRMRHHYLGGNGTKPIAVALLKNTVTETVDISDNYVETEGARYIGGMLRNNTFITNLNISNNFIGREGFSALCRMLETNTTLKTLCVSGNQLTDSCAQCLIEGLKNNSSLSSLDISGNNFGEQAGYYLGGALSLNEGLVDFDCSWNSLRNRGAAALLSCLTKNKTLEVLDLSWNGLGPAGAEALKTALKINTTLKVLDLTNNRLNTKAAESIGWGLSRNTGLETVVLNLNPFKDAGVDAILKAAEKHPNLHLLSIEEINISRENYHKIQDLQTQKDLTILHGGVGGYQRITATTTMVRLFGIFVQSHQAELRTSFQQFDRDRTGFLGIDDLKMALKEAGFRLTNRQLSVVIEELNYRNSKTLNYKDILSGEVLREYYLERPSRLFAIKTSQRHINTVPEMLHRQLTVT